MELSRKVRRWFNVNKFVPEKLRVAKCCNFLSLKLCCNCEKEQQGFVR